MASKREQMRDALGDRYTLARGPVVLSGTQALARLLLDQSRADRRTGLESSGFVTGYPGSPVAGFDLELARHADLLATAGIVHRPGLNEELAATAVAGSQLALQRPDRTVGGVFALWYGKSPGLDRASDALRHGNLMGADRRGGVVVAVGDDPRAKSSSVPSSSEPTLYSLAMPFLAPGDPADLVTLGRHAFELSRRSGLWVGLRLPASVADATMRFDVNPDLPAIVEPDDEFSGKHFVHRVTAQLLGATLIDLERTLYGERIQMAERYGAANGLVRMTRPRRDDVLGVIASGPTYRAVRHALEILGISEDALADAGVRLCQVQLVHPLDREAVRTFACGLREVLVVEDKRPFLETHVRDALYGVTGAPLVTGKSDEGGLTLLASTGELDVDAIAGAIARRLGVYRQVPAVEAWRARPRPAPAAAVGLVRGAYFCAGCPHNSSVRTPEGTIVGSGSGCHGLAIQMNPRVVGEVVGRFQMGGEGAMWTGMSPFVATDHFVQNMGDGTYAHSGSLAIRAAVAADSHITFKLLSNSTVAMTGGQNIHGGRSLADLVSGLRADGVREIIVTSDAPGDARYRDLGGAVPVWDRSRIEEAVSHLADVDGVTVLIHDQGCAAERSRQIRRSDEVDARPRVMIDPELCENCGDCGVVSNCTSLRTVSTWLGPKMSIHQESCNLDYRCLDADCPAMILVHPGRRSTDVPEVPEMDDAPVTESATVRMVGIGGTGVLTVSQILVAAAHLDGRDVRSLDQTGIAQKGGAVVSDVMIGAHSTLTSPRAASASCDLYLVFDPLAGADPANLAAASPVLTEVVGTTYRPPTGKEVADPSLAGPTSEALRGTIDEWTRAESATWLDASAEARAALGSDKYANVWLLGVAAERGLLPVRTSAIEDALRARGSDVERNIAAFRLGRRYLGAPRTSLEAPRPSREAAALMARAHVAADLTALEILRPRVADLERYQGRRLVREYLARVDRAAIAETQATGGVGDFTYTVATQLHRLYAHRDEFEVARQLHGSRLRADVRATFGDGAHVTLLLEPPTLRRRGLSHKIHLGPLTQPAIGLLASSRRARGTFADPWRHSPERRAQADLVQHYEAFVDDLARHLDLGNLDESVRRAGLIDRVRGYGDVRARRAHEYRTTIATLEAETLNASH